MDIRVEKSRLNGEIMLPSSKSHVHRLLIAAAFANVPTKIHINSWSIDIEVTKECLCALGCQIIHDQINQTLVVTPLNLKEAHKIDALIQCRESGSTLRFFLPILGALGATCKVEGMGRLPERPIDILVDEMKEHGCTFVEEKLPLTVKGQMTGGTFSIAGNVSSQFITGLLFALPLLKENSEIYLTSPLESKSYIDMTLQVLKSFYVDIQETETGYKIKGNQTFISPRTIFAEGDWSGAAFWVVAGAGVRDSNLLLKGLKKESTQGDKEIVALLQKMGGNVREEGDDIRCSYAPLKGIDIDASNIPDLVPILCVAGALAEGRTHIYNAGRVRIKESDRLQAMKEGLQRIGVEVLDTEDTITIIGSKTLANQADISGFADHRIVMSFAIAAAGLGVSAKIHGTEAIGKSYPQFFTHFIANGGVANVI